MEQHSLQSERPTGQPSYEPPRVTDYGTLREITAAQAAGGTTDKTFPAGTPAGALTFS